MDKGIQRQVENKFRRSLKEVQLSADEERLSISNMICPDDETSLKVKQSRTVEKMIAVEKENVPAIRRSKRKTAAIKVTYVDSPEELKPSKTKNTQTKKTASKSKKSRSITTKKNEQKTALNQTKLDFAPITDAIKENPCASHSQPDLENKSKTPATEVNEDSGISDRSPMNSTAILGPSDVTSSPAIPYNMISAITAESPPLNYWKDLAEKRRIALDETLHENELLHDQLAVLEAENSQLKQLLKEAENLAQVLRGIID